MAVDAGSTAWILQYDQMGMEETIKALPVKINIFRRKGGHYNKDCPNAKVKKAGVLSRHRHPQPVHGFVLKGRWHYLEHDWTAEEGGYVYEPPGETHTLVVPDDLEEMITYFQVNGMMCYVDPWGEVTGYEDVFTKIDLCRKHFAEVGLGEDYVDQFIR